MKSTLYEQAKDIEKIDNKIRDLNSSNQINVAELQKNLLQRYEQNLVFYDAMQGKQSVEETLEELGQVNKGIRKILPWKKNKGHNERLDQLSELVSKPYHLNTSGIFMPDNLITIGAEVTALAFGTSYAFAKFLMPEMYVEPDLEFLTQNMKIHTTVIPAFMSALMAPILGLSINSKRFTGLPIGEAKYLDGKIQEFYK